MSEEGNVVAVRGQVAEVSFSKEEYRPARHDILEVVGQPGVILEAIMSSSPTSFYCLVLTPEARLSRDMKVRNTKRPLMIPVGENVLGRAFDVFGEAHDDEGEISREAVRPLYGSKPRSLSSVKPPSEVMETGIKAIDFFCPLLRGGKTSMIGGAGTGKTVILTELVNRLVVQQEAQENTVAVFSAVGERSREAHELYHTLKKAEVLPYTSLILGQMGENPAVRFRTAYAGAAVAEYFRDEAGKDVLYFMDNIYRFAQAGHEISTLMNVIPSEDGYQPTLPTEMSSLLERLVSTTDNSISSFMALFVPSDDMTDHAVRSVFPYLDTMIVLSRDIFQVGRFPAIDLLASTSAALTPLIVGIKHYSTYIAAKKMLEEAASLERIVSLIGEAELSPENQRVYLRAQLVISFMTQDLFISQAETGATAEFVSLEETVTVVNEIMEGRYDNYEADDFRYIGSISNLKKKPESSVDLAKEAEKKEQETS